MGNYIKGKNMPNSDRYNKDFLKIKKNRHHNEELAEKLSAPRCAIHDSTYSPLIFLPRDNYSASKDCGNLCWVHTGRFVRD